MSDIDDFFNFSKPFTKKEVSGGTCDGRYQAQENKVEAEPDRDTPENTDYANKYERDLKKHLQRVFKQQLRQREEPEGGEGSAYEKYDFGFRRKSQSLPIASSRERILDGIQKNTVVVLQGSTGCGKTTQVPQYILDDARSRNVRCNIVVAQPRRMAAQTNAERVCSERGWRMGTVVGYQVGSDQREHRSSDTRILYCTTGVLLEMLIRQKTLYGYTHIILDEVHERTKEMDFLMVIIYKFLTPSKRIILMSATINSEAFANYFKLPSKDDPRRFTPAPIINIDAKRNFEVKEFYLDDLEAPYKESDPHYRSEMAPLLDVNQPKLFDEQYTWAMRLICLLERMDRIEFTNKGGSLEEYKCRPKSTVLVFLPGIHEIMVMYRYLEEWKYLNQETEIMRIVLHSTAAPIQAHCAMVQTNRNIRKIILATNIAESSITVPDVKYVIDFCLTRIMVTDRETNFSSLRLKWATQTNCEQRAGRTGRVMPGICFRLVTRDFYTKRMRQSASAEIISCPLEGIILKIKVLDIGSPESILALAMDKPNLSEIGTTVLRLKEMAALLRTSNGQYMEMDGDITFIGHVMASLPIDAKLAKLIVYGYCFSVLNECIIMAAALNCTKNIFKVTAGDGIRSYTSLLQWANGSGSDLFAMLNAFNKWSQLHQIRKFGTDETKAKRDLMNKAEKDWADKHHLEVAALRECQTYVKDLHIRLKRLGLKALSQHKFKWSDTEKNVILKVAISGAFYPNYFLRASPNRMHNERDMYTELDGRDPTKTVLFSNFDQKHVRNIYAQTIKEKFINCGVVDRLSKVKVTFDSGAQKAYVTFRTDGKKDDVMEYGVACQPGFVLTEVYKAILMRMLSPQIKIPVLDNIQDEYRYAERNNLHVNRTTNLVRFDENEYNAICFPKLLDRFVRGSITHIENCDEFYLQPASEYDKVAQFSAEVNRANNDLEPFELTSEILVGEVLAAPYYETDPRNPEYYRAKVLSEVLSGDTKDLMYLVRFIDFGNTAECRFQDLRKFSGVSAQFVRVPPRCFRCALVGIQPSILNAPNGIWPKPATELFRQLTANKVEAEIYSTFDGIARVTIRTSNGENINDLMVTKCYAEHCEENYMSKKNHMTRESKQKDSHMMQQLNMNILDQETLTYLREEDTPEIRPPPCSGNAFVTLNGPKSPLETTVWPMTKGCHNRSVEIDMQSVNAVLLENEPNDISFKYLVSVSVCEKNDKKNNRISVRRTTMMPHIRAFGPLMAAIFSPAMELTRDKSNSHYVSMITGLGYDAIARRAMFAENDVRFNLDTEITINDLEKVNQVRHCMNKLFYTEADQERVINFGDAAKSELMMEIRKLIIDLIITRRHVIAYDGASVDWNKYDPQDTKPPPVEDEYRIRAIFPLHTILRLEKENGPKLMELQQHDKELHEQAMSERQLSRNILCRLCNDGMLTTTDELKRHLMSRIHVDRLNAIDTTLKELYA